LIWFLALVFWIGKEDYCKLGCWRGRALYISICIAVHLADVNLGFLAKRSSWRHKFNTGARRRSPVFIPLLSKLGVNTAFSLIALSVTLGFDGVIQRPRPGHTGKITVS